MGKSAAQTSPRTHRVQRAAGPRARRPETATPAGVEREIKLGVAPDAWPELRRAVEGGETREQPLRAVYFDTAEGALDKARIALRVRLEDDGWVQTLKAAGDGPLHRIEENVPLTGPDDDTPPLPGHDDEAYPAPDLGRHAAHEPLLRKALGLDADDPFPPLQPAFEVRVRRLAREVSLGGSLMEIALDDGELRAAGRTQPIRELEIELLQGRMEDLLQLARRWCAAHDLWLHPASKAARGARLARGEPYGPASKATPPAPTRANHLGEMTAAVLGSCLAQVMANAGEIAAGSQADEHVHQLRVGLRRLRTALRELPPLAGDADRYEALLAGVFRALGARRDRTHVLRSIQPLVEAAGGPAVRVPPDFTDAGRPPGDVVRDPAFQDTLLALLARAERVRVEADGKVRRTVRPLLARLYRQVVRAGRDYDHLAHADRHKARKRLKRLRYLGEFAGPAFPQRRLRAFLEDVEPVQDALGRYNDLVMARGLYEQLAGTDPGARFAVGWLARRESVEAKACRKQLRKLGDAQPFWKD
ncbi:CYTH and CHAD domain-containing protein [Ramlibacter sp. Leaf400]|uniref:CYTH and CHAD domain-containing protein n=1 Tax=Ramlibacter sp. Leaf400 TaxID=1736365 RepID=UPI0006FD7733|nr:CYTH and CHAD domain-containing protein [Ramlibacter sp. Leaf400]KQT09357.1 hypothetical protein ASG30_12340 [Ramlibacter sp. Leaf400]